VVDSQEPISDFERLVRSLYAEGKVDIDTLKTVLAAHKKEMQAENETSNVS
jgi:hypothetical protein